MRFLAALCIITVFEIAAARAGSIPQQQMVQQPRQCFGRELPCAIQFPEKSQVEIDGQKIHVAAGSSMVLLEKKHWQLIDGGFWAPKLQAVTVHFGELRIELAGGVFYRREAGRIVIRNLDGVVKVSAGQSPAMVKDLPVGFENWYRGLVRSAEVDQGVLRAIDSESFVREWALSASLDSKELETYFSVYKKNRHEASIAGAKIYKDSLILREIASLEKELAAAKIASQKKREKDEIRKLFRQRYFEPPELSDIPTLD